MSRKRHTAEEIVNKLRQAEVEFGKGSSVAYAIAMMMAVAIPEDLRNVRLDVPDESDEAQQFTVLACGSRTDLNDFSNQPLGGSRVGS